MPSICDTAPSVMRQRPVRERGGSGGKRKDNGDRGSGSACLLMCADYSDGLCEGCPLPSRLPAFHITGSHAVAGHQQQQQQQEQ